MDAKHTTNMIFSVGLDIEDDHLTALKEFANTVGPNRYNLPPHIGICLMPLPEYNMDSAFKEINKYLTARTIPPTIQIDSLQMQQNPVNHSEAFIFLKISDPTLIHMHEDVLEILNKYRVEYIRTKDFTRIENGAYDEEQTKLVYDYGSINVLEHFQPHITLGSFPEKTKPEVYAQINEKYKQMNFGFISVKSVHVIYHTDATIQSDFKVIKREDYLVTQHR